MERLHTAYLWIVAHWALVSTVAGLVVALLTSNKFTKYFTAYSGWLRAFAIITEVLSPLCSKDVPGWLKWPFQLMSPGKYAVRARLRAINASGTLTRCLVPLALAGMLLSACGSPPPRPRMCKHLEAAQLGGTPWSEGDCVKAQTKRDWLLAGTITTGILGAAAGGIAPAREDLAWRIGWGVTAAVFSAATAGLAPFLASWQKNLSEHCTSYAAAPR